MTSEEKTGPGRTMSSLGDGNIVAEMLSESALVADHDSAERQAATPIPYMQNRELSWLEFNLRVLDQGADETMPLLQRLNFISIFWSNLQEFFMVRVGSLTDLSILNKRIIDTKTNMTPSEQLDAIYARCHELYPVQEQTYRTVRDELASRGITQLKPEDLTADQEDFLRVYLECNVVPMISPQIVNARHPFPHLENGALYVVVRLDETADESPEAVRAEKAEKFGKDGKGKNKGKNGKAKGEKNQGAEGVTLGIIPLPRQCERVIKLPGAGFQFILLENALEIIAPDVFSMYTVKHTNVICVTRNADIDANDGADAVDEDYREHMMRILKKRKRLAPVRLESERPLSDTISAFLLNRLKLKAHQVFVTSVPLDLSYTFGLASRVGPELSAGLDFEPFTPQWPACLKRNRRIMDQITDAGVLLSYPYESMDPFVQLLREAATDPKVLSIKITLYRLAHQSHLAEALIAAAENGKEVTALFELRARFDESNNIEWSQRFEQAGCNVIYGFRDYKVHSKICCITRQTDAGVQHITQLGTGNYNEKTAKLYTDLSFITTDETIGQDAIEFFRNMGLENASNAYDVLWVAPLMIKQKVIARIDREIARAKAGEPCGLFFKTNSVTDKDLILKIVEASQAGVPVTMFVRGICCLVPGVEGYTDNVRVVSIVGRLLEHSRIYGFGPHDSMSIYLSSADLMTRNMEKRVEIAWPVLNAALRARIIEYIDVSLRDTAKLRELLPDRTYTELGHFAKVDENGVREPLFDSQEHFIKEAEKRRVISAVRTAAESANAAAAVKAEAAAEGVPALEVEAAAAVVAEPAPEEAPHAAPVPAVGVSAAEPATETATPAEAAKVAEIEVEVEPLEAPLAAATPIEPAAASKPAAATPAPVASVQSSPASAPAQPAAPARTIIVSKPKKRGFLSRLFGFGK